MDNLKELRFVFFHSSIFMTCHEVHCNILKAPQHHWMLQDEYNIHKKANPSVYHGIKRKLKNEVLSMNQIHML